MTDITRPPASVGFTWQPTLSASDVVTIITSLEHRISFVRTLPVDPQVTAWLAGAEDLLQRLSDLPGMRS